MAIKPKYLKPKEAAEFLNITVKQLYSFRKNGYIGYCKPTSRSYRYPLEDVKDFIVFLQRKSTAF